MTKKTDKKLHLNHETMRVLNSTTLAAIAGGYLGDADQKDSKAGPINKPISEQK